VIWRDSLPCCPVCNDFLSGGPRIKVGAKASSFAERFRRELDTAYADLPVDPHHSALRHTTAVWLATRVFETEPDLRSLADYLIAEHDIGLTPPLGASEQRNRAADHAIRYIQLFAASDYACTNYPEVTKRYKWLHNFTHPLNAAARAIERGLVELASRLGLPRSAR
jgi:hypothetical protein